jgi:4-amino-4-deoxy-L-arabinose transferase-like glycosyltransferase
MSNSGNESSRKLPPAFKEIGMKDNPNARPQPKGFLLVPAVVLLTIAIRVYLVLEYKCINQDGVQYVQMARLFSSGDWKHGLAYFYPPGYPVLVSFAHMFVRNWELAGQVVSFAFGCFTLFPLYFLMKDIYSRRIACLSMLLLSFSPYHAKLSAEVRSEAAYIFFMTIALLCLHLAMKKSSLSWAGACGVAGSAAYLVRPEGGGILFVAGIFLLLHHLRQKNWNIGRTFILGSAIVFSFLLLGLPYIIYLRSDTGRWIISRKASNVLALGLHEYDKDVAEVSQDYSSSVSSMSVVMQNPWIFFQKCLTELCKSVPVFAEAIHFAVFPFFLMGLILRFSRRHPPDEDALLWIFFLFYLLLFSLFFANRRFFVQLVPVALGCTALGVESAAGYLKRWAERKQIAAISSHGFATILFLIMILTLPKTLTPIDMPHRQYKEAGLWLQKNTSRNDIVVTDRERIAFYAERKWIKASEKQLPSLGQISRDSVVYYALAERAKTEDVVLAGMGSRIKKVAEFNEGEGEGVSIYRFNSFGINDALLHDKIGQI